MRPATIRPQASRPLTPRSAAATALAALTLLGALMPGTPAWAGPNADARILVHLLAPTRKNACTRPEATPECAGIVTKGTLAPQMYYAYLLVVGGDAKAGVAGIQCGIRYDGAEKSGVDVLSWKNCGTLEFPSDSWPASGGGNLVTWDASVNCQRNAPHGAAEGVQAVIGYFYCAAYGADTLRVIPRPVDGFAKVADCKSEEDLLESRQEVATPSHLGFAVFSAGGKAAGYSPCGVPAKAPTSAPAPTGKGGKQR